MTMSASPVRLFIKPSCGWCRQAMRWLDDRGVRYQALDVIADSQAHAEMVRLSGQSLAPVLEVNGQVLADFGAAELAAWWPKVVGNRDDRA
ncbi:MAG: glutaredoxin family protein [Verrucomicrobia bacterium]|nr:glutaredoxin family protein [Verrucomicrobiota bacterium]